MKVQVTYMFWVVKKTYKIRIIMGVRLTTVIIFAIIE